MLRARTDRILQVRPRFTFERQRLVHVERDHLRARELDQEVAHRGDRNLLGRSCGSTSSGSSALRFTTSACALAIRRSNRSSAFTPSPLRPTLRRTAGSRRNPDSPARAPCGATAPPSRTRSDATVPLPVTCPSVASACFSRLLQVGLTRVDHVVGHARRPEVRRLFASAAPRPPRQPLFVRRRIRRRRPQRRAVHACANWR